MSFSEIWPIIQKDKKKLVIKSRTLLRKIFSLPGSAESWDEVITFCSHKSFS